MTMKYFWRFSAGAFCAAGLIILISCGEEKTAETEVSGEVKNADEADMFRGEKFHPLRAYTIIYELNGLKSGTVTEHARNYGNEQAQITDTTMTVSGITIRENKRVIIRGRDITTIDFDKKTVAQMTNPLFDSIATHLKGKDAAELGRELMIAMGHEPTGVTETVAGENCEVWKNAQLGQEICVTSDALTLRNSVAMMGMNFSQTAKEVRRGDPGPDEAYTVPEGFTQTQTPDLGQIMGKTKAQ